MLFERTAIAKRPEAVVQEALSALGEGGRMTPDLVFRDPYSLQLTGPAFVVSALARLAARGAGR